MRIVIAILARLWEWPSTSLMTSVLLTHQDPADRWSLLYHMVSVRPETKTRCYNVKQTSRQRYMGPVGWVTKLARLVYIFTILDKINTNFDVYIFRDNTGVVDLYTTVVPKSMEGQGIGKLLAEAAFGFCQENNLKMKLTCWYLDGYLKRHPKKEYQDLVVQ